jgi:hypothetical protein
MSSLVLLYLTTILYFQPYIHPGGLQSEVWYKKQVSLLMALGPSTGLCSVCMSLNYMSLMQ